MKTKMLSGLAVFLSFTFSVAYCFEEAPKVTPEKALKELLTGNERYTKDALIHPNRTQIRREAISSKQTPFAVVVGCSDSRVSPEIVFDQGLGDLFVVRVAGNVVGPIELASIEFAVEYLGSCLIIVLGHENCGAVKAVLDKQTKDIEPIAAKIEASLQQYSKPGQTSLEDAVKTNVLGVVEQLKKTDIIKRLIDQNKLDVVGGYYQLNSGKVILCCDGKH